MSNPTQLIKIAKAEVGYHEGFSNGHWNNKEKYAAEVPGLEWVSAQGQPWCATFVSWVAMKAGLADLFPRTASTDLGASWFKDSSHPGVWSEYPSVGDQVFFGHDGDMSHTGIVIKFDATYVYTVEGNTNDSGSAEGDGVYYKRRARHDEFVQGYGRPAYNEIVQSADPNYHAPKPASGGPAKPPVKHEDKPTRVEQAIDLLETAADHSKNPKREQKIEDALDALPQK